MRIAGAVGCCFALLCVLVVGTGRALEPEQNLLQSPPALPAVLPPDPEVPEAKGYERPTAFRIVRTIETDADFAQTFTFSPDSKVLVIADGPSVRFVDPRTGKEAADPWKFAGTVRHLAFVSAETLAVCAEPLSAVSVRAYPSGKEVANVRFGKNQSVSALAARNGTIAVATGAPAHTIRLLTAPDWRESWHSELPENDWPVTLVLSPNGKEVIASRGSMMRVFATKDGSSSAAPGATSSFRATWPESGSRPTGGRSPSVRSRKTRTETIPGSPFPTFSWKRPASSLGSITRFSGARSRRTAGR